MECSRREGGSNVVAWPGERHRPGLREEPSLPPSHHDIFRDCIESIANSIGLHRTSATACVNCRRHGAVSRQSHSLPGWKLQVQMCCFSTKHLLPAALPPLQPPLPPTPVRHLSHPHAPASVPRRPSMRRTAMCSSAWSGLRRSKALRLVCCRRFVALDAAATVATAHSARPVAKRRYPPVPPGTPERAHGVAWTP